MDPQTISVYQQRALEWTEARQPPDVDTATAFGRRTDPADGPVVDLGCGPGWFTPHVGANAIALDATPAMLARVPDHAPDARRVLASVDALPFRRGALGGAYASKVYVHLPRHAVPAALADLHRALAPRAPIELVVFGAEEPAEFAEFEDDAFAGRRFSLWSEHQLVDVVTGAGFAIDEMRAAPTRRGSEDPAYTVRATRRHTLPDTVGADMNLLVVGLNPSPNSADSGIGFMTPGNRFWPAAIGAGLASVDRDPFHALRHHGLGLTDLVKRPTRRADELDASEYRSGFERVSRLAEWLQPAGVCFVGLAGYRLAVNRKATAGRQPTDIGGRPVYVMPSTSGLNAHSQLSDLTDHLRAAARMTGARR